MLESFRNDRARPPVTQRSTAFLRSTSASVEAWEVQSLDETKRLLEALDPTADLPYRPKYEDHPDKENQHRQDNYDLVVLLLDTGARYSEIANIIWDRIDLEDKVIHLWRPKVRNESIIYMTRRMHEILKRRSESKGGDHVFTNSGGGARGYSSKGIFNAFERAGLHDFRIHVTCPGIFGPCKT